MVGDRLSIWSGNDDQIVPIMSLGGKRCDQRAGQRRTARHEPHGARISRWRSQPRARCSCSYLPLIGALFAEPNPIPVKNGGALARFRQSGRCGHRWSNPIPPALDELEAGAARRWAPRNRTDADTHCSFRRDRTHGSGARRPRSRAIRRLHAHGRHRSRRRTAALRPQKLGFPRSSPVDDAGARSWRLPTSSSIFPRPTACARCCRSSGAALSGKAIWSIGTTGSRMTTHARLIRSRSNSAPVIRIGELTAWA